MGPKGRHSYSTATKLNVIELTRLRYLDGGVVGKSLNGGRAVTGAVAEEGITGVLVGVARGGRYLGRRS